MKRFWIGLSILILLLAGGIGAMVSMDKAMSQVTDHLRRAQQAAAAGDLEQAERWAQDAQQSWGKSRPLAACLAEHGPLELVDQGFSELEAWAGAGDCAQYEALCHILEHQVQALVEEETPRYYNIL